MMKNVRVNYAEVKCGTSRLTGFFRMTRVCYSQRSEDVCKTLINVAEA